MYIFISIVLELFVLLFSLMTLYKASTCVVADVRRDTSSSCALYQTFRPDLKTKLYRNLDVATHN